MRILLIISLLGVFCAVGKNAQATENTLPGASASITVTATVDAPLGVFFDKDGVLQLEAPNNSGVFLEHSGQNTQASAFVIMEIESAKSGPSPRIATKRVSGILEGAIFKNDFYKTSSAFSTPSSTEINTFPTPPILTIIYTEN